MFGSGGRKWKRLLKQSEVLTCYICIATNLYATNVLRNTFFKNATEETLETAKHEEENNAVTRSQSKLVCSLMKGVHHKQKGADMKNYKLERKSPAMKRDKD